MIKTGRDGSKFVKDTLQGHPQLSTVLVLVKGIQRGKREERTVPLVTKGFRYDKKGYRRFQSD